MVQQWSQASQESVEKLFSEEGSVGLSFVTPGLICALSVPLLASYR